MVIVTFNGLDVFVIFSHICDNLLEGPPWYVAGKQLLPPDLKCKEQLRILCMHEGLSVCMRGCHEARGNKRSERKGTVQVLPLKVQKRKNIKTG